MPHVALLSPNEAHDDVQTVYEEFYRRMAFPYAMGMEPDGMFDTVGAVHRMG